jgi:integrase
MVFQDPKTYGSQRSISLPNLVMIELERHQRIQRQERISKGNTYQNNDLIITTSLGTPVSPRNLLRSFKKILKKASLPDIRLHDIRHTHATLMLQQGEHPKIVSERLGHSNTRVTLDTYSHVLPNMQKDAVERFEKYYLNFNHSQT